MLHGGGGTRSLLKAPQSFDRPTAEVFLLATPENASGGPRCGICDMQVPIHCKQHGVARGPHLEERQYP